MAALVLYASLYPFSGWRWPPGQSMAALLRLPWPPWIDHLDELFNLLGYLPLGLLAFVAARRSGQGGGAAWLVAVAGPALLSYGSEVTQHFLPGRHPSLRDLAMNTAGAAVGAGLGALAQGLGLIGRWHGVRLRWFTRRSAGALALVALWPLGLLFPAPVPFGLGQVGDTLRELLAEALAGVPWAEELHEALVTPAGGEPLGLLAEATASTLGLLAPCLLTYAITPPGWRRGLLAVGGLLLAVVAMTLSTLLNFGPAHAFTWTTPATRVALFAASLLAVACVPVPRRVATGLALAVLAALVALISHAPTDPYFAQNLQGWEQGRFVRFHGLAQWIGWLWPYAAIGWLITRLADRD